MIESLIESGSTYSGDIDFLFTLVTVIVGVWFVVSEVVFFYFMFRYRARDGVKAEYIGGDKKSHKKWISIPHWLIIICDIVLIVGAVQVWHEIKQKLPEPDEIKADGKKWGGTIRVIGQQWAWTFVHPGADLLLDTADDIAIVDDLHLEVNTTYHYELTSRDVLHCFSVPLFRLKQDSVPGREIKGWFCPTKTGEYDVQCAEMCGIGHGVMAARVTIHSEKEFSDWLSKQDPSSTGAPLQGELSNN
ncbi:MAG: cytochrome c oxidase subunit II [Opitutales bacterium]|jgi:cytochrome c oxidase subunit II